MAASPRRAEMRPPIENGVSPTSVLADTCVTGGSDAHASRREPLDGFLQYLVFRIRIELGLPERPRLVAIALAPEHFAQVRRDFGVGAALERLFQVALGLVEAPHPV